MDPVVGAALAGGGISAAGNLIGGLMDNLFAERNARIQYGYQQKLNENQQKWNEKNMAIQNQYQIDQWNRENAYNDPSAVRQRYEAAGVSPQAAFGQGAANGAGIAGSLSSAPSGGMPSSSFSMPHVNSFGGLGDSIAHGAAAASSAARVSAENKYTEQQVRKAKWENDVLNPILEDLQTALKDEKVAEATIKQIDAKFRTTLNQLEVDTRTAKIGEIVANTNKMLQEIETSKSYESLNKEQKKLVSQHIKESQARVVRMAVQNKLDDFMAQSQEALNRSTAYLNSRKADHYDKGIELMEKQIDKFAAEIDLTNEQKAELLRRFNHDVEKDETILRNATSAEVRKWLETVLFDHIPSVSFGIGASVGGKGGK